ncbi:MAG: hypothetical protein J6333_03830 [Planctomycetes bacterium]|nr:hypothetical protein [Planctomycetota bacterium]
MERFPARYLYLLLAVAIFFAAAWRADGLADYRAAHRLNSRSAAAGVPPAYALADGLLGGFRGFLISTLWQRAQDKKQNRQFYEMVDLYKIISTLEPNYPNAWANMAWDLSYNVAAEFEEDPRERVYWIFAGVNMLRDEAIRHNPHSALLYDQLSWIFFNKMANSVDPAYPLYRRHLALEMTGILDGGGSTELLGHIVAARAQYGGAEAFLALPEVQALQAELAPLGVRDLMAEAYPIVRDRDPKFAHVAAQMPKLALLRAAGLLHMDGELRRQANMDAAVMLELNREFSPIDWRMPQAYSLYWAWLGQREMLAANPNYDNLKFIRMIYFSLIQLAHIGNGFMTEKGLMIATPNPAMVDGIVRYMTGILDARKGDASMTGMRSGFEYFLLTTVFNFYFSDNPLQAERARETLLKFTGSREKYGGSLTQFVNKQLPEFIDGLTEREATMLLVSFCQRAFRYLMLGNPRQFQEQMAWFDSNYLKLYKDWKERFQGTFNWQEQFGMPAPDELKARMAAEILAGRTGASEKEIAVFRQGLRTLLPKVAEEAEKAAAGLRPVPGADALGDAPAKAPPAPAAP